MLKIGSKKYSFPLFVENDLSLVLMPCIFSNVLIERGTIFKVIENENINGVVNSQLVEKDVDDNTIRVILNRLETFLEWIEDYSQESKYVSLSTHHNLPGTIINDVLIKERGRGEKSIHQHLMALNAYYNYLAYSGFTTTKNLYIKPDNKEQARTNTKSRNPVKYLTPELRSILYRNTSSIRDELLLKTGGEIGCRSGENLGFLVSDFNYQGKNYPGMLSLFKIMEASPDQIEFEYFLQGKFTKSHRYSGGKSRTLYIHRDLLSRFKDYYEKERPKTEANTFFVNDSSSNSKTAIAKSRASRVFTAIRKIALEQQEKGLLPEEGQQLEPAHTHHILRHSFGTDKFYEYSEQNNICVDDVTPTSQPYLTVAALLGHSANDNSAPKTTSGYIRSCHIKLRYM
ncbi:MAG TPA: site-specific integrase [Methylophaga aminisulfidivorans]|uniref:Site-specific integrase n=1 Tax=Methylophaga aminisulfidivorans TaxID=230105 RepID=A0A7C1W5I1_9GAMM|nr:site-specific integrase [Methylophaga aminisulfidivorans]